MSWIRIRLPGGTLKFKPRHHLRRREWERQVPVWRIGAVYVVWWPRRIASHGAPTSGEPIPPGRRRDDFAPHKDR